MTDLTLELRCVQTDGSGHDSRSRILFRQGMLLKAVSVFVGAVIGSNLIGCGPEPTLPPPTTTTTPRTTTTTTFNFEGARWPAMSAPTNVNFGGWLCLEDWFFSGRNGTEVSTLNTIGQGACLPPLLKGPMEAWPSEGVLVHRLVKLHGEQHSINILQAHRENYITVEDLRMLSSMEVRLIRIPISWVAFVDALKDIAPEIYGAFDPLVQAAIVPDPFYKDDIKYVTIPRNWLRGFLQNCTDHGLKVLLDIHAFPGGSSQGTYNGIYPLEPVFWFNKTSIGDDTSNRNGTDVGHMIVRKMIEWIEGLDVKAFGAIGGITVMNEPAHQLAGKIDVDNVLLPWLAKAADFFRQSKLPLRGVKLYMNLIESAFASSFWTDAAHWWNTNFNEAERTIWAVFDLHHYFAWNSHWPECNATTTLIDSIVETSVMPWVSQFRAYVPGLKSSSEFSLSTSHNAAKACTYKLLLKDLLAQQAALMKSTEIEPIFWTWRMPYGPNFEAQWSYRFNAGWEDPYPSDDPCLQPTTSDALAAAIAV